jgi:hypothetical protein
VRVPSWQAEADLAAWRCCSPITSLRPAPLHLMFQPSRLASPKIRPVDYLVQRWRGIVPFGAQPCWPINRIIIQLLNRAKWQWYTKPLINRAP